MLVAIQDGSGAWGGYFGFEKGAAYSLFLPATVHIGPAQRPPMYWIDAGVGTFHRLVGESAETFLPRVQNATGLALEPTSRKMYWTDADGNIRCSNLNGQDVEDVASSLVSATAFVLRSVSDTPAVPMNSALVFSAAMAPDRTHLLANYPNPFNPETWIPYQLAQPAEVALTIYDIQGRVVRHLDFGHQRAGIYQSKSRAAYWDGRNAHGEPVASGVYFYTLTAGDFSATKKMLIRK